MKDFLLSDRAGGGSGCKPTSDMKKNLKQSAFRPYSGSKVENENVKFLDLVNVADIAHVYPCQKITANVNLAINKWDVGGKEQLLNFITWLFTIDAQAVINEGFLLNAPGHLKSDTATFDGTYGYWLH
jgi:hypothetical protein